MDVDLDAEFDPDKYDEEMKGAFDDEYYAEEVGVLWYGLFSIQKRLVSCDMGYLVFGLFWMYWFVICSHLYAVLTISSVDVFSGGPLFQDLSVDPKKPQLKK